MYSRAMLPWVSWFPLQLLSTNQERQLGKPLKRTTRQLAQDWLLLPTQIQFYCGRCLGNPTDISRYGTSRRTMDLISMSPNCPASYSLSLYRASLSGRARSHMVLALGTVMSGERLPLGVARQLLTAAVTERCYRRVWALTKIMVNLRWYSIVIE